MLMTQQQFDAWASGTKRRYRILFGIVLLFMVASCVAAIAIMGPRLVREGALLWFGTRAEGTVQEVKLEQVGAFKGGAPQYRLTIDYRFSAADGRDYSGTTVRTDVRTPPDLTTGDQIGVYYNQTQPTNSVAEHNLRTDVYALLLFLPFLSMFGIAGPLFFAFRFWNWRRLARR
jgi:hypothetical protein